MGLPLEKLTLEAYLAWENAREDRHEFHRGEVFAMVGGRRTHGQVVMNLGRRFSEQLDGTRCRVFAESMKVQIADDTIFYPDVSVTCDTADLSTEMIFRAPVLVTEVLSPTTQGYDRSLKFAMYRRLSSLREYLLVDPDTRRVEAYRLDDQGRWIFNDLSDDAVLAVPCLDIEFPMAQVFAGIDPPA